MEQLRCNKSCHLGLWAVMGNNVQRQRRVVAERFLDDSIQEMTLVHHDFGGCLQSQVKCIQCLHESNRYEPMMDLLVDIQGDAKSVEDALAQFKDTELSDGANKYKCDQYVLVMCSGNIGGCFHVHLQGQEIEEFYAPGDKL